MREALEGRHTKNIHRKPVNLVTQTTALSNSVRLIDATWGHPDRWVMVESSDKTRSIGEGNGKPLQYSCIKNPKKSMKRQNNRIMKEELPR